MIYQYFFGKNYSKSERFVELTSRNTTQICALQILSWTQTYLTGIFPIINNMLTDYSLRFKLQTMVNMKKKNFRWIFISWIIFVLRPGNIVRHISNICYWLINQIPSSFCLQILPYISKSKQTIFLVMVVINQNKDDTNYQPL